MVASFEAASVEAPHLSTNGSSQNTFPPPLYVPVPSNATVASVRLRGATYVRKSSLLSGFLLLMGVHLPRRHVWPPFEPHVVLLDDPLDVILVVGDGRSQQGLRLLLAVAGRSRLAREHW